MEESDIASNTKNFCAQQRFGDVGISKREMVKKIKGRLG